MRPKGKLLALVAMFAAVGLITATGAFTTVEAQRTATVDVTGDSSALLQITGPSQTEEGTVDYTDGVAEIDLTEGNLGDASGLNPDATTTLTPLANVTNNGVDEDVEINITVTGVSDAPNSLSADDVSVVDGTGTEFSAETVGSGETVQFGLKIDLTDVETADAQFDIDLEISAEGTGS